ncbi:MAG: aldo/keto reductase [Desulfurococcales archaeon ex4484_204]|nr:MAG: aldo/keto reductase [Desulfurococcales archaeon ex4484_204]
MEYTVLGRSGLKVSRVGLGTWQFSEAWGVLDYGRAKDIVLKAVELGVNFFDTAIAYGLGLSESFLGRALREGGVRRDEVVVCTKIPGEFLNPVDVPIAVDKSLKLLGLNYVDVLLAHWPPCWHHYPTCSYARAMERLVRLGRVKHLGLSDFPVELVEAFRECLSREDIVVLQVRYNLVERWAEAELLPYAEKHGLSVMAWSPLARGALTGKYGLNDLAKLQDVRAKDPLFHPKNYMEVMKVAEALKEVGSRYGKTAAQVAINWLIMSSPAVIPIPGAKTPAQVEWNAGSTGWRMSYDDWRFLDDVSRGVAIKYSIWYWESRPCSKQG